MWRSIFFSVMLLGWTVRTNAATLAESDQNFIQAMTAARKALSLPLGDERLEFTPAQALLLPPAVENGVNRNGESITLRQNGATLEWRFTTTQPRSFHLFLCAGGPKIEATVNLDEFKFRLSPPTIVEMFKASNKPVALAPGDHKLLVTLVKCQIRGSLTLAWCGLSTDADLPNKFRFPDLVGK